MFWVLPNKFFYVFIKCINFGTYFIEILNGIKPKKTFIIIIVSLKFFSKYIESYSENNFIYHQVFNNFCSGCFEVLIIPKMTSSINIFTILSVFFKFNIFIFSISKFSPLMKIVLIFVNSNTLFYLFLLLIITKVS